MRINLQEWLPKYYPRLNSELFGKCLQDVGKRGLPKEEFLYIILGCGYLFYVRRLDEENELRKAKEKVGDKFGTKIPGLGFNEKEARKEIRELGLVIGPEERPLTSSNKRGPRPRPTTRITTLTIDIWLKRKLPGRSFDKLACRIHEALSGESIKVPTFIKMRKRAEGVKVKNDTRAVNQLAGMLENRYTRFKNRNNVIKDISVLYPIRGVMDVVLMAVGVILPRV